MEEVGCNGTDEMGNAVLSASRHIIDQIASFLIVVAKTHSGTVSHPGSSKKISLEGRAWEVEKPLYFFTYS